MSDMDQAAHVALNRRNLRPSRVVAVFRLHEYLAAVVRRADPEVALNFIAKYRVYGIRILDGESSYLRIE